MSINPDENEMIAISNKFAKAMGSFVQTDFQYFGYLRNRQRYYIGSKFVGGSSPSPIAPKKIEEKIVKKDNNFTRGKDTKNPNPINVLLGIPEKVKEEETTGDIPVNVVAPEKQGQPDEGGNTIKDFERQKDKEKQKEKELEPTTILPEWDKSKFPTPHDYWMQYGEFPEGSGNWKNQPWDWGKFFNDMIPALGAAGGISLPNLLKFAFADGGYVRSATPALIGEAGPELVIPVAKFGEAIEAMYREGASVLISSSLGFLKKLPNSTARAGVMAEANTLASIFGISAVDSIEGNFGLSGKLQNFSVGGGTGVDIPKALPLAEQQMQGGGGGGGLFNLLRAGKNMLKKTKIGKKIGKGVKRTKTVAKGLLKKAGRKIGVKSVAKIGGKALGKGLLKKIPFIGLGAGLLFAGQRMMAGDFKGAGLEMLSGVAGTVPGIGTAVSVGLDATLAAKDMNMIGDGTPESSTPNPRIAGNGMPIILNPSTMKAWERAVAAAAKDGVNLPMSVTSSYRSAKQQQELIDRAAAGDPNVMTPAPVGLSPHGQGWAVDINFYSKANEWMRENGGKYGFKWQGEKDPVHFDFWNNEPNDKWLQPGNRDWIPNNIAAPEKKSGSEITNPNIKKPNVSEVKNKLIDEPVKQSSKQSSDLSIAQMTVPIPIPTPLPYAVPTEVNKDVDNYVVIDVFGKGSKREVVS